jgi:threonylcarbamoyladenosine tRNA methylthiotransferase MtaB
LKHSPHAFVAVTGCYAQTGADTLKHHTGVDLIVGAQHKLDLPAYLPPIHELEKRPSPDLIHTRTVTRSDFDLPEFGEPDGTRALVKIQDGCSAMCSFCIIPFARGHERSRTVEDIINEVESLVTRGYREIVLTGVNIGQYLQNGQNFCSLLRRLEPVAGLERIRISSIEPTTVSDELLDLMASSLKVCPYLHIPLQSGDDRILSAMHRRHTAADYVALIRRAVMRVPGLGLGTDLMVGFPGEDEAAFRNTMALTMDLPFSYLHVFSYSPRPGTAALRLGGQVPPTTAKKRSEQLHEIASAKRLTFHKKQIGTSVSALFERGLQDGYRTGTAPDFTKVAVAGVDDLQHQIRPVTITAATERWAIGQIGGAPSPSRRPVLL